MEEHTKQHEWDIHFMKEAKLWSERSKCLSRNIGSVLVKNNRVLGTGYNGPPSGVPHCDHRVVDVETSTAPYVGYVVEDTCPRHRLGFPSGEGMRLCPAVHAEINPIIQAAREGRSTIGSTLYCYCGIPCKDCMKEIVQAGVKRIVCLTKTEQKMANGKDYNFYLSEELARLGGVEITTIEEEEING